ncbi:general substrate transporter [Dacryopinax primogenitus]|uniref:General substrate transporter n=1 Tax=Dacryopinax primogenitus (strain DJM 731) TaxID=1858805 RepID=M5FWK0_DACPD|nr:general substrate transporter [Dacryopinax primogenitus]EJT97791.1 general substrate transporter [Dacryopinax primogenitus]
MSTVQDKKPGRDSQYIEESDIIEKGGPSSNNNAHDARVLAKLSADDKSLNTVAAIRKYWVAFLWAMYASVGSAIAGYDITVSGAVVAIPSFRRDLGTFIDDQWVISAAWQSGFNAGSNIFQALGAFATGFIGEKIGRKGSLLVASIISIAALFLQFFIRPHDFVMFFFGRSINGFAVGIYTTIASSYCAEVSPLALRGVTTGAVNFWILVNCGFISYKGNCTHRTVQLVKLDHPGNREPRRLLRVSYSTCRAMVLPGIRLGLPSLRAESPWYLVRRERMVDAKKASERLFGGTGLDIDLHLIYIKETIELEERIAGQGKWVDLFRGTDLRRTIIAGMVFICQEMVGVQFVLGYSVYFFDLAGFNDANAFHLGVGTMALAIVGNLIGIGFTNRLGRRPIFFWGMVACTIDTLMIGVLSLVPGNGALWAMGVFTMLYMLTYQAGIGPLAYCIFAEISTARLRSKTVAWGVVINQIGALIIQVINPYLINPDEANMQGKVGWLFGGLGVIFTIWSWFGVPETGGRTIDEIDILFEKRIPARQFRSYVIQDADRIH